MKKIYVLAALSLFSTCILSAKAQMVINMDVGQQKVTYGSSYDTTYKGTKTSSGLADLGAGFVLAGHSQRKYGVNFLAAADLQFPFNGNINTGGITSFGGVGQVNARFRSLSLGTGLDIHYDMFPEDSSSNRRPDETLVSIPIVGKYNFGPAGRAYIQGGGAFFVGSSASTVDAIGNTFTTAKVQLSKTRTSDEVRLSGGYMFGKWGLRANYTNRNVFFDATSNPTSRSYFDFHQNQFTGGFVFTAF